MVLDYMHTNLKMLVVLLMQQKVDIPLLMIIFQFQDWTGLFVAVIFHLYLYLMHISAQVYMTSQIALWWTLGLHLFVTDISNVLYENVADKNNNDTIVAVIRLPRYCCIII